MILIMMVNINFCRFCKQHDEFEEMSLDSKHIKMKELKRLLNNFES